MRVPAKRKDPQRCGSFFMRARFDAGAGRPDTSRVNAARRAAARPARRVATQCRCDVLGTRSAFTAGGVSDSSLLRAQKNRSGRYAPMPGRNASRTA